MNTILLQKNYLDGIIMLENSAPETKGTTLVIVRISSTYIGTI